MSTRTEKLRETMIEQVEDILKAGSYNPVTAHFLATNIVADNLQAFKDAGGAFVSDNQELPREPYGVKDKEHRELVAYCRARRDMLQENYGQIEEIEI